METVDIFTKCSANKFSCLVHGTVDKLLGRAPPTYNDYSDIWSSEEWWRACDQVQDFCQQCSKENCNPKQVADSAKKFPECFKSVLSSVALSRKEDLHQVSLIHAERLSGSYLRNFDWKLKFVMSSDKLGTVHEPLVNVELDVVKMKGSKPFSVEMDKTELESLIAALENVNQELLQLRS